MKIVPTAYAGWQKVKRQARKNWLSCVLEDAALFTGVADITMEATEQQATDRNKEELEANHPTTRKRPSQEQVQSNQCAEVTLHHSKVDERQDFFQNFGGG